MTEADVPAWVEFVNRLRTVAEIYGPDTELHWLLNAAGDKIAAYETARDAQTRAVVFAE